MPLSFWIRRYVSVLVGAFVVIAAAQLLQGHAWQDSLADAALWAAVSATVFTVARYLQARRGQHCALCRDTPELRQDEIERRD
jgi:sensor domain CHASE-containing protein